MKDIHTHILFDVDDGANTLNESISILEKVYKNKVTDIILTPHYIQNTKYNINNLNKQKKFKVLQRELLKKDININIYLGNEVYIDNNLIDLLDKDILTLNNSKYILIELPQNEIYPFLDKVLSDLKGKGLIPIIAHPERYNKYYQNYSFFNSLIKSGCFFQGNIGSLYGIYGRKSKKMLKEMLKRNMIHFLASDIHYSPKILSMKKVEKDLLKIVKDSKKVDDILNNNAEKVIKNKKINCRSE